MTVDTIPELTEYQVTATFKAADGSEATPSSASYRLVDAGTDADIIAATPIAITGPTATITIPAASNTCLTPGTRVEYKQLIITATDIAQVEHLYRVSRVPAPAP